MSIRVVVYWQVCEGVTEGGREGGGGGGARGSKEGAREGGSRGAGSAWVGWLATLESHDFMMYGMDDTMLQVTSHFLPAAFPAFCVRRA